jgi:hypothetical protein
VLEARIIADRFVIERLVGLAALQEKGLVHRDAARDRLLARAAKTTNP